MLDRREFLTIAAATAMPMNRRVGCVLLAVPGNPLAAESLRGYQRCFDFEDARLVVVPGLRTLSSAQWLALRAGVLDGACVILESGLAFASAEEIGGQRAVLWNHFGIRIAPALTRAAPGGFRYIRYHWPVEALVRDFSESVTIDPGSGESIASVADQVVAIRRRLGRGNVIYLGSPLGPALLAGDAQAEAWVRSVVQYTSWR